MTQSLGGPVKYPTGYSNGYSDGYAKENWNGYSSGVFGRPNGYSNGQDFATR
ncbi:hypothetical protein SCUCBS95973_004171 [Sporothrix curviconia]|uniref:Uncharacterized protein n=1 Tax=Sporothrix curviconia TaxID=1260050 RepID=A0ABP0BLF3_9PEZI